MHSDDINAAEVEARTETAALYRLLDPAFGFFVWAVHLLVIYIWAAVACQLGSTGFVPGLVVVTVIAAGVVVWHGARRYRKRNEKRDDTFLLDIAVGQNALALLAIVWQLYPILMVPVCR